jgi:hypothetical protein
MPIGSSGNGRDARRLVFSPIRSWHVVYRVLPSLRGWQCLRVALPRLRRPKPSRISPERQSALVCGLLVAMACVVVILVIAVMLALMSVFPPLLVIVGASALGVANRKR